MSMNQNYIKTGAEIAQDASFNGSSTIIASTVTDATTAETAFTTYEALTWDSLGHIAGLEVGQGLENAQEITAMNCGVGVVSELADVITRMSPTLLEVKNFELWSKLLGGASYTDGTTNAEYFSNAIAQIEVPLGRFRIKSCAYKTNDSTAGKERARDYYYLEKASLDGEILLTFLNKGEVPTGSQFSLNGKTGGHFFVKTVYGATEVAVS